MDILQSLPPLVALALGVLLVVWLVLFLLVPFMLESIRSWSRKTCHELEEMNQKLDRLTVLLDRNRTEAPVLVDAHIEPRTQERAAPRPPRDTRTDRARKEPTIG
jgi:hypothetical protein